MKTLPLVLFVAALLFSGLAAAEEDGAPNDPDDSERSQFTEEDLPKDEKDPAGVSEIDECRAQARIQLCQGYPTSGAR